MRKYKVFVSFDYDNDFEIKENFIKQSKNYDIQLILDDKSISKPFNEKWKRKARDIIKACDCVIFLCGEHTDEAKGVSAEMSIAQEENIPYFLVCGRKNVAVSKPINSLAGDYIHKWQWKKIKRIIEIICD